MVPAHPLVAVTELGDRGAQLGEQSGEGRITGWPQGVQQALGPLKSYTLESETADTRFSGDFYILQYHTVYAHGDAHEIITIREPSDKDQFHIIGDHIQAKGL